MTRYFVFAAVLLTPVLGTAWQDAQNSATDPCKDQLPQSVQSYLVAQLAGWDIQRPSNLTDNARVRWQSEKPLACPGIAIGYFKPGRVRSYAVLLVRRASKGYKLVIFSPSGPMAAYDITVLEESPDAEASNRFIHREPVSKFLDPESRAKFAVRAVDALLIADAGEEQYETDIYFWTRDKFHSEPVDY